MKLWEEWKEKSENAANHVQILKKVNQELSEDTKRAVAELKRHNQNHLRLIQEISSAKELHKEYVKSVEEAALTLAKTMADAQDKLEAKELKDSSPDSYAGERISFLLGGTGDVQSRVITGYDGEPKMATGGNMEAKEIIRDLLDHLENVESSSRRGLKSDELVADMNKAQAFLDAVDS